MPKETGLVPKDILDANNCPFVPLGKSRNVALKRRRIPKKNGDLPNKNGDFMGFHGISWRII